MEEQLKRLYCVLWDEAGCVSSEYDVREGEIAVTVVETGGSLTWFSEQGESPRVEQILQTIHPAKGVDASPAPPVPSART